MVTSVLPISHLLPRLGPTFYSQSRVTLNQQNGKETTLKRPSSPESPPPRTTSYAVQIIPQRIPGEFQKPGAEFQNINCTFGDRRSSEMLITVSRYLILYPYLERARRSRSIQDAWENGSFGARDSAIFPDELGLSPWQKRRDPDTREGLFRIGCLPALWNLPLSFTSGLLPRTVAIHLVFFLLLLLL